jgi:outer membrane autotransporter protein
LVLRHNQDQFSTIAYSTPDVATGQVGLKLSDLFQINGRVIKPYIAVDLWRTFSGSDTTTFAPTAIITNLGATALETKGGIVMQFDKNVILQASAGYITNVGGDYRQGFAAMPG